MLVRTDFDASEGLGSDRFRLALPTLEAARSRGAKLIVATTQTPNDSSKGPPDIEAAAARLAEAFGVDVLVPDECAGDAAKKIIQELRAGQVCVLPDLGSEPEQAENEHGLAERLGALADVYVNDAFAASHRKGTPFDPLPRLVTDEHGVGRGSSARSRRWIGSSRVRRRSWPCGLAALPHARELRLARSACCADADRRRRPARQQLAQGSRRRSAGHARERASCSPRCAAS